MPQDWFKCLRKKKKSSCLFLSATARRRKPKKSFSSDWTENLAVIKGSYFSTSTFSARWSKIPENYGWRTSWRSGKRKHWKMAKVPAGEDQRIRDLSLLSRKHWTCGKCTNLGPLGLCQNDSCPSHETNLASVPTKEKSRAFALNRASVLRFRAIGGGHTTASKGFSFLGRYCIRWTTILN